MSYREIPQNRILRFSATPGFSGWKDWFTDDSTTHPAKMNLNLLEHIIEAHTSLGDVVLDPMAGTGSTIVLAAMLGRHGIAVEYEPHFCDMIQENIKRSRPQSSLMSKGSMACIQGDARELSKLLKESDVIITSPPYSDSLTGGGQREKDGFTQGHTRGEHCFKDGYSKVDSIVSSPPYGAAQSGGGIAVNGYDGPKHSPTDLIGERSYMPD
ncbi:hypothetical protein E3J95_00755, partial [Candidatus Aerophobetes bacterium]